jgi:hypothetical protein
MGLAFSGNLLDKSAVLASVMTFQTLYFTFHPDWISKF